MLMQLMPKLLRAEVFLGSLLPHVLSQLPGCAL
jgi:hypothetical protein